MLPTSVTIGDVPSNRAGTALSFANCRIKMALPGDNYAALAVDSSFYNNTAPLPIYLPLSDCLLKLKATYPKSCLPASGR
jgi:hypothetical protein